jgi:hypothetical protein
VTLKSRSRLLFVGFFVRVVCCCCCCCRCHYLLAAFVWSNVTAKTFSRRANDLISDRLFFGWVDSRRRRRSSLEYSKTQRNTTQLTCWCLVQTLIGSLVCVADPPAATYTRSTRSW